jgi:hypothetical protein
LNLLTLAIFFAHVYGYPTPPGSEALAIAKAIADQCGSDIDCVADGSTYAAHESGYSVRPKPVSADSKSGASVGVWQTPARITPRDIPGELRVWLAMRARSLLDCGDLTELASGMCVRGRLLVASRENEIAGWLAAP